MKLLLIFSSFSLLFANVNSEIIKFYKKYFPTIKIISIKSNKKFPKKYHSVSFKLANPKLPSSTLIIDGKYYFYTINATVKVYIASKVIRINMPVLPNVIKKNIKFRTFYSTPLYKISPDLIATKIISKNAVINKDNTRLRPFILKNQRVNIIFKSSSIDIYAKGTALNDAEINQSVKVKIKNKTYTGTATKNGVIIR